MTVPVASALIDLLVPLREDPAHSAVLFDVDGTLAPIVRHASDAHVPELTRSRLIAVARRYGTVACVSGRPASVARQIISIGSIAYLGNHGSELLPAGSTDVVIEPQVAAWTERVRRFAAAADTTRLQMLRVRMEDKGPIVAFHWRGAPDEAAVLDAIEELAAEAAAAGLQTHHGRKVLEIRPPVPIDKGRGIVTLLAGRPIGAGVYVGDDATDVDAFRGLREAIGDGAICIGVASEEVPDELTRSADTMVDGPDGVREVLDALLAPPAQHDAVR